MKFFCVLQDSFKKKGRISLVAGQLIISFAGHASIYTDQFAVIINEI
jgi:hypothetical protein